LHHCIGVCPPRRHAHAGFSLVEALIASLIVATAAAGLSHLVTIAVRQSTATRRHAIALALAQGQLEMLRAVAWSFAPDGTRLSDERLALSPPAALVSDIDGYSDRVAGGYRRRWAISLLDPADPDMLLIEVCVFGAPHSVVSVTAAEACVSTLRVRRP
jgi:type II secretory pathway pseudopilin PulG